MTTPIQTKPPISSYLDTSTPEGKASFQELIRIQGKISREITLSPGEVIFYGTLQNLLFVANSAERFRNTVEHEPSGEVLREGAEQLFLETMNEVRTYELLLAVATSFALNRPLLLSN
jgi:hypothetical protein